MREPPAVATAELVHALQQNYDLSVQEVFFLPLGNDAATSVYRASTVDGTPLFLKLRAAGGFSLPSLFVPDWLRRTGIERVPAPLRTNSGELWVGLHDFALAVYPFLEGQPGRDAGLSDHYWREVGALVRGIHASQLPTDLATQMPRERFVPSRRELFPALQAAISNPPADDPIACELAACWGKQGQVIERLLERADALGEQLRQASPPLVLCHADLHPWNLLLDGQGQLWLIDWDETILAPRERDLMFAIGGIGGDGVGPAQTASFLAGYGDTEIDPTALAYYRYAWAVQDLAAYGECILLQPERSETARREALRYFRGQFGPQCIVALALSTPS